MERSPNDGSYLAYWGQCGNRTQYRNHREIWTEIFGLIQLRFGREGFGFWTLLIYERHNEVERWITLTHHFISTALNLETDFIRNGHDVDNWYILYHCIVQPILYRGLHITFKHLLRVDLVQNSWPTDRTNNGPIVQCGDHLLTQVYYCYKNECDLTLESTTVWMPSNQLLLICPWMILSFCKWMTCLL